MTIEFHQQVFRLPAGPGRLTSGDTHTFSRPVNSAFSVLNGFKMEFTDGDHELRSIEADTDIVEINGRDVTFQTQMRLEDQNGDDSWRGYATVVVIADLID